MAYSPGTPSSQVTRIVYGDSSSSHSSNEFLIKSCDVCFRAKQTRQCFSESLNNAKEMFDLIHCDLWGRIGLHHYVDHVIS